MTPRLPSTPHGKAADGPAITGRGVLVVDDDALVRDTLVLQLEADGVHVATAATLGAAQTALDGDPLISVVVCDIHLDRESGFDLAGTLADLRPERLATEIVFITGDATGDTAIAALRHRAFDLIRKPLRRAELVERVGDAHRSATRRRQHQALLDQVDSRLAEGEAQKQRLRIALRDAEGQHRAFEESTGTARRDLLAVISHELKTPLIPIVGLSDIMLSTPELTPEEIREFAGHIRDGGERLEAIIDRTLSYLDAERQHTSGEKGDFAVDALISTALRDLPGSDGTQAPEIEIDCPAGLRAWGARALLAQALRELVDNALKASPTGGKVRIMAHTPEDGRISIDVTDNGPGLPELVRKNLGVPFLQGDTSLTRRWSGVGIGLARAKKIAQLSDGDVTFGDPSDCGGTQVNLALLASAP